MFTHNGIGITWLGHDGFLLKGKHLTVCIDPFKVQHSEPADVVLITHEHQDHLSLPDIKRFMKEGTHIVCPQGCAPALKEFRNLVVMAPGQDIHVGELKVHGVPAYNTNKYRDPDTKTVFHPKADGKLGYLLTLDGVTIYHAGDTDMIPEMEGLAPDVALLPVSGTYVMTAEEAAQAAHAIKPKLAIPMHYGAIVGSPDDAKRFTEALKGSGIPVKVLDAA
jgi:L-ascorbate metabolism protein UlaG (beta-lactamase superfamily)